ncbi:hypothetical protein TNCV_4534061 [Trichonephila clavipes]|nr:hypothetical protein TNCV_4534061 [Trichonephila clavipes]
MALGQNPVESSKFAGKRLFAIKDHLTLGLEDQTGSRGRGKNIRVKKDTPTSKSKQGQAARIAEEEVVNSRIARRGKEERTATDPSPWRSWLLTLATFPVKGHASFSPLACSFVCVRFTLPSPHPIDSDKGHVTPSPCSQIRFTPLLLRPVLI